VTRRVSKLLNPDAKLSTFQLQKEKTILKNLINQEKKEDKSSYEVEGDDMHLKYRPHCLTPHELNQRHKCEGKNELWNRKDSQKRQLPNRRVFNH
jgi:hypothetical protein